MFLPLLHVALPHVKAGKLDMLAAGSLQRTPVSPDVPSLAEATGVKNIDGVSTRRLVRRLRARRHAGRRGGEARCRIQQAAAGARRARDARQAGPRADRRAAAEAQAQMTREDLEPLGQGGAGGEDRGRLRRRRLRRSQHRAPPRRCAAVDQLPSLPAPGDAMDTLEKTRRRSAAPAASPRPTLPTSGAASTPRSRPRTWRRSGRCCPTWWRDAEAAVRGALALRRSASLPSSPAS